LRSGTRVRRGPSARGGAPACVPGIAAGRLGAVRIIAGIHLGRRIAAPPGRGTRPMLDRMPEALFSTLAPWLPDAVVLDLFAGSGSLGLEALSRGARSARLVERDAAAARVLADNVALLG